MSRVIHCELILPITAKFIRVCTMYVQCMYNVYHGSWRDFGTAVGAFSIRVLFASLARHTIVAVATIKPVPGHGKMARVVSVSCLQRMAQLSDLVIWCARN